MAKNATKVETSKAQPAAEAPRLRVIPNDETFSRSVVVDPTAKTVTVKYAVKTSKESSRRYEVTTKLDFASCNMEDILSLAADSAIITVQRNWRVVAAGKEAEKAYDPRIWAVVNVKTDILDVERRRGPVDPVLATRRNLEKMGLTPEAVEKIMAEVAAQAK